jgi:two-component system sensor histidine kinase DesK
MSLIVVKAEVVRRLVERDPALARQAAADIEEIGRRALTEVREAVDGYRAPDFTTTVDTVRAALADSRIALRVRHDGPPLPPATSQTFGWVIREAATNAIRHSHAKAADVTLTVTHVDAVLEFRDDGRGVRGLVGASRAGSGLIGLRERVTAAGGTFSVGNVDGGGFRVVATMPAGAAIDTGTRTAETAPGVRTIARAAVVSVASADAAPDDREAPA